MERFGSRRAVPTPGVHDTVYTSFDPDVMPVFVIALTSVMFGVFRHRGEPAVVLSPRLGGDRGLLSHAPRCRHHVQRWRQPSCRRVATSRALRRRRQLGPCAIRQRATRVRVEDPSLTRC